MLVYCATNAVNGMQYVGLTRRSVLKPRINEHISSSRRGVGKHTTLAHAMREHGEGSFDFRVVERVDSLEALSAAEKYWIKKLNTTWPNGYNSKIGGCHTDPLTTGKKYVVQGKVYYGCGQLGDAFGIQSTTVRARLETSGWSVRQAVGLDEPPERQGVPSLCKPIWFRGEEYPSQTALAKKFGVTRFNFEARINNGWTVEEALEVVERKKPKPKHYKKVCAFGREYYCLSEAARELGVNPKTAMRRIADGWSVEDALTGKRSDITKNWNIYEVEGKTYIGQEAIAEAYGLTVMAFRARLNRGHTLEKALGIKKGVGQRGHRYFVEGKEYFGRRNLAEAYGLTHDQLATRMRRGFSVEEALGLKHRRHKCG